MSPVISHGGFEYHVGLPAYPGGVFVHVSEHVGLVLCWLLLGLLCLLPDLQRLRAELFGPLLLLLLHLHVLVRAAHRQRPAEQENGGHEGREAHRVSEQQQI